MKITMIGHSTVRMEVGGKRILTDPWFGRFGNPAYARVQPPALTREQLRDVDLVLVSHNHFDHTDRRFLRSLPESTPVLAPAVTAWMTRLKGGRNVIGLAPWKRAEFGDVSVTSVPARHVTFTIGYVIAGEGKQIYFAGDTYFAGFMPRIAREFHLDVALMPVTTFRIPMTMGEKSALRAAQVLAPKTIIPIHLGIRPRSPLLRTSQTPEGFQERARQAGLPTNVVILHDGESWSDVSQPTTVFSPSV
jgi:L-ascorbate metabolism protein UlaG (beta-lactamase superfamily)